MIRFFLCLLLLAAPLARADEIRLVYFAIPPLAEEKPDGATGPAIDLLRDLTEGLPVSRNPLQMPVKRLENTLETEAAIAVGLGRTPRREAMGLIWVAELFRGDYYFVTLRGHTPIQSPADAGKVGRIACNLGSTPADMLQALGISNVEYATGIGLEAAKLHAGHVDAWFDLGAFIEAAWRGAGNDPDDLVWSAAVPGPALWITASPKVPAEIIETMRRRYAEMQAQGKLDPLFARLTQ